MEADAYFALGKSHTVCQDYAEALKEADGVVVVAVSDGCSSSRFTDFGARFLVRSTISMNSLKSVVSAVSAMDLPYSSLDATLLSASPRNNTMIIHAFGDGVIVLDYEDGARTTIAISFSGEAPAYLSYELSDERMDAYLRSGPMRTASYELSRPGREPIVSKYTQPITRDEFHMSFFEQNVSRVFLCSDGVRSFRRQISPGVFEPVPLNDVLEHVTSIRSSTGEFMVRRMRRFLYDFCPKNGWVHDDDIAVAAIINS